MRHFPIQPPRSVIPAKAEIHCSTLPRTRAEHWSRGSQAFAGMTTRVWTGDRGSSEMPTSLSDDALLASAKKILRDNDRGSLHDAEPGPLSLPVELGFLPDRARPAALRRGARMDRDRDAARPPMARRDGAAHRLPCRGRGLFPGAGGLGDRPADADLRHHPAAGARLRPASPVHGGQGPGGSPAQRAGALAEKVDAWHRWFYRARDPAGSGLVAILHPWESGRDNSVDWDEPLSRVPTEGVVPYRRRDTQHVDAAATADAGRVRPLSLAGAAFPLARLGQCDACTMRRRSAWSTPASTPS